MFNLIANWIKTFRAMFMKPLAGKKKSHRRKNVRRDKEHHGAHYYLGDLLDQIDDTFKSLRLLKKHNREDYNLFSKAGVTVVNGDYNWTDNEYNAWFDFKNMPAFGACHYPTLPEDKEIEARGKAPAKFLFFKKMKRPYNVQPSNDTVFIMTAIFEREKRQGVCDVYISVDNEGEVKPLKMCQPQYLPFKKQGDGAWRMKWDWPEDLKMVAQCNGYDPYTMARSLFITTTNVSMTSSSGITVRAKKKKDVATFAIDMLRTPYFFADRDKVVDDKGQTKKIFHIVRGHYRQSTDGAATHVKTHFRGLRRFTWSGYQVLVSMNGKNNTDVFDFKEAAREVTEIERQGERAISSDDTGRIIEKLLDAKPSEAKADLKEVIKNA